MLTELCAEIRNYFLRDYHFDIHGGTFTISDGSIEPLSFLQEGQYYIVVGSQGGRQQCRDACHPGSVWAAVQVSEACGGCCRED